MHHQTVKIVIIGNVDNGKSTLIARLLLDTNSLPEDKVKDMASLKEVAFLLDQLKEEREKEQTIDTTQISFKIRNKQFMIIDTPGHLELLKNMITGASQAEACILIIDAKEGITEQTKRHLYIISLLGIDKVIVVLNKMDLVEYSENIYEQLKKEILRFFGQLNITPIQIIPISAKEGSNIVKKHAKLSWFKGPVLLAMLNKLSDTSPLPKGERGRVRGTIFPIQDIYEIDNQKIIAGRIENGVLKTGQEVLILPYNEKAKVESIKIFGKSQVLKAIAKENIGLILNKAISLKRGDIITNVKNFPKLANTFRANLFWLDKEPLLVKASFPSPFPLPIGERDKLITLRCATQEVRCFIERIEKRINSSSLEIIEENAKALSMNETGIVVFKTEEPILVEKFSDIPELGRLVVQRGNNVSGVGIVC